MLRSALLLALALTGSALAGDASMAQRAPRPAKPVPVPTRPMPALPPAQIDNSLIIGGDEIDARELETRMTVEVRVNGQGPYRFVVDSGADSSVVGHRIARDLSLPAGSPVILNSMTASARVDRVRVNDLLIGPSTIRNLELPVLRERDLGGHGMLGIDALIEQRLMMDFEKNIIKVEDARRPAVLINGEIVVTARRKRGQLILTEVTAAGYALDAVVDTGSQITIGNLALRDRLIRGNRDKFITVVVTGVTGVEKELQLAKIGELKIGKITLRDVPMAFADLPPFEVFGLSREPALLIGTDVLETFRRVSLDFRARRVRFQLRRCGTQGIAISTGLQGLTRLSSGNDPSVCQR